MSIDYDDKDYKQVIIVNTDLDMRRGKIVSQACHASVKACITCIARNPFLYGLWDVVGHKKVVLRATKAQIDEIYAKKTIIPKALIIDQGLTQIPADSTTCLAIGPWTGQEIDELIGERLKLLQ